jgi:hypothetical protein
MKIKSLIIFFIILLFPFIIEAKNIDYVVKGIAVNETASNASNARKVALQNGQRQAFDILSDRMEIKKDRALWISDEEIDKMVSSIKINQEKISRNNYSAILDITFDKEFTKYIFAKHNIDSGSQLQNKYLIIPVITKNGEIYIWEEENIWLQLWQNNIKEKGIKSLAIPEKDIDSLAYINKDTIDFDDSDDFMYLTEYYNVNSIIVLNAEHLERQNKIEIMLTKIIPNKKSKLKLNFFSADNVDEKTLFTNATEKTLNYIITNESSLPTNIKRREGMTLKFTIAKINDYLIIDKMLKQLDFLNTVKLDYISKKMAEYHVTSDMDDYALLSKFEDYGFLVRERNNEYYLFLKGN